MLKVYVGRGDTVLRADGLAAFHPVGTPASDRTTEAISKRLKPR